MLIVATGNGKGKTTAAIGQAIRALGHGKRIFFLQFVKSEKYPSGEDTILRGFGNSLRFVKAGRGFVGIMGDTLPFADHRQAAHEALAMAKIAARSGTYDLLVLDELNVAVALKLLTVKEVMEFLAEVQEGCDVVVTGRNAPRAIVDRADFVTECVEIKHPFHKKIPAKAGIDY